jgi:branched-chain amino acid aminotransferase
MEFSAPLMPVGTASLLAAEKSTSFAGSGLYDGGEVKRRGKQMAQLANERVAYFNGKIVPESQVLIPFRDRSFRFGDGGFDMTRTFNGRAFKLREHVERFYRTLQYLQIDIGLSRGEMTEISDEVLERNLHLLGRNEDYWLGQRVSRGVDAVGDEGWDHTGPTVIVECIPLPLKQRAAYYRDGIDVIVPSVRRVPPDCLTPRAKTHNYLNLVMGDLEAKAHNPKAWAILLDVNGNLCEGLGSNFFLVRDGALMTPREQFVLPGVSRQTVMDLAAENGITVREKDIDLFDAYNADEAFLSSTSLCLCPVRSVNGVPVAGGAVPGRVTGRLLKAYSEFVDCDFVGQYLSHLD